MIHIPPCKCDLYAPVVKNGNCRLCTRFPYQSYFYKGRYYKNVYDYISYKAIMLREIYGRI